MRPLAVPKKTVVGVLFRDRENALVEQGILRGQNGDGVVDHVPAAVPVAADPESRLARDHAPDAAEERKRFLRVPFPRAVRTHAYPVIASDPERAAVVDRDRSHRERRGTAHRRRSRRRLSGRRRARPPFRSRGCRPVTASARTSFAEQRTENLPGRARVHFLSREESEYRCPDRIHVFCAAAAGFACGGDENAARAARASIPIARADASRTRSSYPCVNLSFEIGHDRSKRIWNVKQAGGLFKRRGVRREALRTGRMHEIVQVGRQIAASEGARGSEGTRIRPRRRSRRHSRTYI